MDFSLSCFLVPKSDFNRIVQISIGLFITHIVRKYKSSVKTCFVNGICGICGQNANAVLIFLYSSFFLYNIAASNNDDCNIH